MKEDDLIVERAHAAWMGHTCWRCAISHFLSYFLYDDVTTGWVNRIQCAYGQDCWRQMVDAIWRVTAEEAGMTVEQLKMIGRGS